MDTYPVDQVNGVVGELTTALEAALEELQATRKEAANWKKQAEENRIFLDKVAAEKQELEEKLPFSPNVIDATADKLISLRLLEFGDREKLAKDLQRDPNVALKLAQKILNLSALPTKVGRGIPKSAATSTESDPDGWDKCLNGAG